MFYVVVSGFILLICMNLIATWKVARSSKHKDWRKKWREIVAVWVLPVLGAVFLVEEHSDFKQRFGERLRGHVYPRLLELEFQTKRPNGKYAGGFPVNYFRERDGELDLLSFVWRTLGRFTMVIALERISDPAGILDFRDQGWNAETFRYRDFGGRVAERGSVFGPK
jgi:hypothetical protein